MSFQKMYGLRGPWGRTAVLQLTYELRPKWENNKRAKMPFLGRTLGRGPTKSANDRIKYKEHLQVDMKLEGENFAFYVLLLQLQTL